MNGGGFEPLFLTREQVLAFHHRQIALFGGAYGIIDPGLLDSALAQPQTTWCYDPGADLLDLAAAYAFHLSKNHAFRDGNKRVALHAALAFLRVNGLQIVVDEDEMFDAMSRLVIGAIDKSQFAAFLREHGARIT